MRGKEERMIGVGRSWGEVEGQGWWGVGGGGVGRGGLRWEEGWGGEERWGKGRGGVGEVVRRGISRQAEYSSNRLCRLHQHIHHQFANVA